MRQRRIMALAAATAAFVTSGCYDDYYRPGHGYYAYPATSAYPAYPDYPPAAYQGREWSQPRQAYAGELTGPGAELLDPWLAETAEGRAVVTVGFNSAAEGVVSEDVAHRANIWFRRYADQNRDMRFTDGEIRNALVAAAAPYLRPPGA
jgi:hypothetical protein